MYHKKKMWVMKEAVVIHDFKKNFLRKYLPIVLETILN